MQLVNLIQLLAATGALVQAAPAVSKDSQAVGLVESRDASTEVSIVDRDAPEPATIDDVAVQVEDLDKRSRQLTRFVQIAQGDQMRLASGAILAITSITAGFGGGPIPPTLDGPVDGFLSHIGDTLGQHNVVATSLAITSQVIASVSWSSARQRTPALTGIEWQTLIIPMYRYIANNPNNNFITVAFALSNDIVSVTLQLSNSLF
ncbi:hypothetical protein F5Y13DRAFT_159375 [Hypoxylon sp. FL1857]|nr:hypothetical protein F5Y13DRAFT_159375 [Hypoxylon sp. FL1857]